MEWQPIETAPKDGTAVLLACHLVESDCTIGYHELGTWRSIFDGMPYLDQSWLSHWMPLPEAPK